MTLKPLFLSVLVAFVLLGTGEASAQKRAPVFSPALFNSSVDERASQARPRRSVAAPHETQSVVTFLYFNRGQTDLTKEMKDQLVPLLKRLSSGETNEIMAVGVSKSEDDSRSRLNKLAIFFRDYRRDVGFQARVVDKNNVLDNNNVVQIIEKK